VLSRASRPTLIRLVTYGAFFSFFLFGFVDNLKGPLLPPLLDDLALSYVSGGTILLAAYLGFLIATLVTGPLSDIAGKKIVIFVACVCLLVGMLTFGRSSTFGLLTLGMGIVGFGLGSLEVGGNLIMVDLHPHERGRYLNLLAFFHGSGSMLVPLYAGRLLDSGVSWRTIYQSGILMVLVLFVYFAFVAYPTRTAASGGQLETRRLGRSTFTTQMILLFVAVAVYVAAEIGIGSWLVEFLQKAKGQSVTTSTLYLALFFGAITAGRFVGSFLVDRIGYRESLLAAALASTVFVAIGTFGPRPLAIFLPLTGAFFSIIFPNITATVSNLHTANLGTILGLLFTFAGVGGMLGPWSIGLASDWLGIRWGFGMALIFCGAMSIAFALLIMRKPGQAAAG
jgi:fucose permease